MFALYRYRVLALALALILSPGRPRRLSRRGHPALRALIRPGLSRLPCLNWFWWWFGEKRVGFPDQSLAGLIREPSPVRWA